MQIMTPYLIFVAVGTFMGGQIMLPRDKEKSILYISICGVFINIGLNYFMIPLWGRNGAAIATVITETIISVIKVYQVKYLYKDYKVLTRDRLLPILSGIIASGGVIFLGKYLRAYGNFLSLIIVSIFFMIIYGLGLYISRNKFLLDGIKFLKGKLRKR